MGITQLSYFVRFFGGLVAIITGIIHDKKFDLLKNVPKLFRVLVLVKPTFSDFATVWDEFRDLSPDERQELGEILAIELDYSTDNEEQKALIESGVESALGFLAMITRFKK